MTLEPKALRCIFKWILVCLTAAEVIWLYSILIFLILNIISFQMKRWNTSSSDDLMEMIWWVAQGISVLILRISTAYFAYFKSHVPSFILIWSFDAIIIILTLIMIPVSSVNTGVLLLTRFTLEILLSLFLIFLQVSDTVRDDQIPAYVVRRVFVHQI